MKTEAQKQFDADYLIQRRLFMMCTSVKGGVDQMKSWLRRRAAMTVIDSGNEIRSGKYDVMFKSPSVQELYERKWMKDIFGEEDE